MEYFWINLETPANSDKFFREDGYNEGWKNINKQGQVREFLDE